MFTIYHILCKPTNKAYVGKTNDTAEERWKEHVRAAKRGDNQYFMRAIRKYGPEAFEVRTIDTASTEERSIEFEKFYIRLFDTKQRSRGYNLTDGGEGVSGFKQSQETILKRIEKVKGDKHWTRRISFSEESREKRRQKMKGAPCPWKAHGWLHSPALGLRHTEEAKKKISRAKKGKSLINAGSFAKGQIPWNKGKKWSPEVVAKMKAARWPGTNNA